MTFWLQKVPFYVTFCVCIGTGCVDLEGVKNDIMDDVRSEFALIEDQLDAVSVQLAECLVIMEVYQDDK